MRGKPVPWWRIFTSRGWLILCAAGAVGMFFLVLAMRGAQPG